MTRTRIVRDLIAVCRRLDEHAFVAATDGNVSTRLPNGHILITRAGVPKGRVGPEDLVEVTPEGKALRGAASASTELGLHLFIYRERQDVGAVVHAHPVFATGFAAARIPLDADLFPEAIVGFGTIPLAEYATPSTPEVANSIRPFVRDVDAILLANHGVVTFGGDLNGAYLRMEKVEQIAQTTFVTRFLGGGVPLSAAEREKLQAAAGVTTSVPSQHKPSTSTQKR